MWRELSIRGVKVAHVLLLRVPCPRVAAYHRSAALAALCSRRNHCCVAKIRRPNPELSTLDDFGQPFFLPFMQLGGKNANTCRAQGRAPGRRITAVDRSLELTDSSLRFFNKLLSCETSIAPCTHASWPACHRVSTRRFYSYLSGID